MTPNETSSIVAQSACGGTRRFVIDAFAGLGLFCLMAVAWAMMPTFATDMLLTELVRAVNLLVEASAARPDILFVAAVFSVIFALNTTFFRHLACSYTLDTETAS